MEEMVGQVAAAGQEIQTLVVLAALGTHHQPVRAKEVPEETVPWQPVAVEVVVVVVAQICRGQTPRVAQQVVLVETEPHLLFLVPL
jgi:hypothetical protein